ncbi:AAA family ATPase [Parabacteroides merdae]|mgnify:FL=1|uniref:AAA family ATPase n=1 Tax=Parabacteroides merdae TaxID=46503 RepID=UPI001C251315|nr:AAA family ATPase [Parabacteroides merdae]MBU9061252.1 ATP-dependent exonuclease [Parabacteroides merdae]MCG4837129.1 ATP-dependent exonuclease [Parabacteroides merdae]MCQ5195308.1 ATP-dependent exonuclease [Parabacteroides merdae]
MKILAIRGRNLASLEGDFEIDFTVEPLLSAGIFAISGPTGAGKSTLLDTMCLALFARTPRTDQAKENNVKLQDVSNEQLSQSDPRFLLRRGTSSGFAEVDFMALNGHRYRTRWSVARARDKENGRLQNPRLALYNLDKEEEEQGTRSDLQARIIDLIGLTFEQFTRSVLLAQNDFSTFLKAEQGEKASLLEKLTGTELYSAISRQIFERNARAKEAFDLIQTRIQGIELLTDEEENDLRIRLAGTEKELQRVEKAKTEQQALQEAVRSIEQQITIRQRQQKEAADKLVHATDLLTVARHEYEKGVEEQQQSEARFKSLQQEILQARKLDIQLDAAIRDLSHSEQQLKNVTLRKGEAEKKYQAAILRQKLGMEEIARLTAWRERYKEKESIAEQLSALLLHLDAASAARSGVEAANRSIETLRQEVVALNKQLAGLQQTSANKQQALKRAEADYRNLEEELKAVDAPALDKQIEKLRQEREQLLIEQARLEASGNIKDLRGRLQDGQPCPVCGSTHHPFANQVPVAPVSALTLQLQDLSNKKETYVAHTRHLTRLQQQLLQLHKELADSEAACKEMAGKQQLAASRQEREEAIVKEQSTLLTQSLSAADLLFGNSEWQKAWLQNPETFRKTLTDFARQWHENIEKLHQLERQESAQKAECESLASFLPSLEKQAEESGQLHEKNRAAFSSLQAERKKLLNGRSADSVEQEYIRRMEELKERLKKLSATQTEQSGIADQTRGIADQIAKDLTEASADLLRRKAALDKWTADYLDSSGGEPLEVILSRFTQEKTELAFRLRTQTENKAKVSGLQEELNVRRTESERWAKLNELAGSADGAKFRRIAQGYTLDILLNYANVQLRELTRRYRLERVPETLALQVIDRDMCDEVRTVHSLSGGESFLVSLALALGLSSLSSNRMRVESLFIDEGFGSLDAETLRVAMDALESLRTQGRKIGVISHVQEMTERIPVRICVNRAGNGRSFLEVL